MAWSRRSRARWSAGLAAVPSAEPIARRGGVIAALIGTIGTSGLILATGVLSGLLAARALGPDGRGELAAMTVWAATLVYAAMLGLPEAVAYFAAVDTEDRPRVWTTGQAGAVLLGLLVMAVGWAVIPVLFAGQGPALADSIRWYVLVFAVPAIGSLCANNWLQGSGRLRAFNVARSTVHVLYALAAVLLVSIVDDPSVSHFAAAMLLAVGGAWALGIALGPVGHWTAPSAKLARRMLHYGIRVQVGNWLSPSTVRLDQLLLSVLAPAAALGLYVVAVSYAALLLIIPGSAALVMLPEIVREHRDGAARACVERWYRRLLWAGLGGSALVGVSGVVLIPMLFGAAFSAAVPLLALLVPATVILGMNQILATAFRGIGRPGTASRSELVGVIVTALALAALLPPYGASGAAVAWLLAAGASQAYLLRQATRVLGVQPRLLWRLTRADRRTLCALVRESLRWRPGGIVHGPAV